MPPSVDFFILQTIALLITAFLIPRLEVKGPVSALIAVFVLAYVNSTIWDAALFFAVPDNLSAHSAVLLLANGVLFWALAKVLPGIEIRGFLPALVAPVVFSVTSVILRRYASDIDWAAVFRSVRDAVVDVRDALERPQPRARWK